MSASPRGGGRPVSPAQRGRSAKGSRLRTLDRVLSRAGAGSRTVAARWIEQGRVRVDGRIVKDPARWIDPAAQRVSLDGRTLGEPARRYLLLYKPRGILTTARDPAGRRTIGELLPPESGHLFSVGRLDRDTSGLLLVTNDSGFAERMTNPDYHVPKTYLVKASTRLDDEQLEALRKGVELKDGPTRPADVRWVREAGGRTVFEITLTEGRNRQVRRMVEAVGGKVLKLVRVAVGPLRIGDLVIGHWRELAPDEVRALERSAQRKKARERPD